MGTIDKFDRDVNDVKKMLCGSVDFDTVTLTDNRVRQVKGKTADSELVSKVKSTQERITGELVHVDVVSSKSLKLVFELGDGIEVVAHVIVE